MTEHHGRTALDECAAQLFGDLRVEARQHLLLQLDDRHLGAEGPVKVAELQPDCAGADHYHAFGQPVVDQRFTAGQQAIAGRHAGKKPFARAGRDQDTLGFDRRSRGRCFSLGLCEGDRMRAAHRRVGLEVVDLVFPEEEEHAARELVGGFARARDHALEVDAHFAGLRFRAPCRRRESTPSSRPSRAAPWTGCIPSSDIRRPADRARPPRLSS